MPTIKPKRIVTRKRRSKLFPETIVQNAVLEWLRAYNYTARNCVVRIMNEGRRTAQGHVLAEKMGMYPGASDIFLAWPTIRYSGLWLEVKREKYKPTKSTLKHYQRQMEFIMHMRSMGYAAEMGVGVDQCILIIKNYLKCS